MVVILETRSYDFAAYFQGNPSVWEAGKSKAEALGKLVMSNPHTFGDIQLVEQTA
jgi:citrate lyase synthetase